MNKLAAAAFAALAVATAAAFFVTQHLKVTTPLLAGFPHPSPSAINPYGNGCGGTHRSTFISFYLLHRADDVAVYVIDQSGSIVRTLASGRHMRRGVRNPDGDFRWNGREDNGTVAPDGNYYFRVALIHQGRTVDLSQTPVTIKTTHPTPVVTSVSPSLIPQGHMPVRIRYTGNEHRGGVVRLYRTDLGGRPRLVKSFLTPAGGQGASWDGLVGRRPAAAGTYLVGLDVTDAACNTGQFPPVIPPAPGSTPHAGVTVRYLALQPPFDPVAPGSHAVVYVDSRRQAYSWSLYRIGRRKAVESGKAARFQLRVHMPSGPAGLYELAVHSGSHRTAVPLVAHATHPAKVLVVLPALTWQGLNPVDDNGDGLPNTLAAGTPIVLARPLANGLPAGFFEEAGLLSYLDKSRHGYDLTTDLGLLDRVGPGLAGHDAVVLAGSEQWLPATLSAALRAYVQHGGSVVSLGIDSLRQGVTLSGGRALNPTPPANADVLGARHGSPVAHSTDLINVIRDGLGIFTGTSGTFAGFTSYEPISSLTAPLTISSAAGVSYNSPSIVGYHLGRGRVVEIGLPDFGAQLNGNVDAQELVNRLWSVLAR